MLDKGKAASVTIVVETKDKATGNVVFENQAALFIRGSGGFGGKRTGKGSVALILGYVHWLLRQRPIPDRGAATAANTPPKRSPDAVVEEKTLPTQAALYR